MQRTVGGRDESCVEIDTWEVEVGMGGESLNFIPTKGNYKIYV